MATDNFTIRPMTTADIAPASALARAQGWRDRQRLYEFVLRVPTCQPLVGTVGGLVVATGLATANGRVGWLGAIVVDAAFRRRGFGRTMTEVLIARLWAAGCETISLTATEAGQPLYEQLGFRVLSNYVELHPDREPFEPTPPAGTQIRALAPDDLPSVCALDRLATGEDRHVVLEALADWGGWVLEDVQAARTGAARAARAADAIRAPIGETVEAGLDPTLHGFLIPTERGHGTIVAPRFEDGAFLMDLHHHLGRGGQRPRCGVPAEHGLALAELTTRGWRDDGRLPRMVLGEIPTWRPTWIWGQINSAMG